MRAHCNPTETHKYWYVRWCNTNIMDELFFSTSSFTNPYKYVYVYTKLSINRGVRKFNGITRFDCEQIENSSIFGYFICAWHNVCTWASTAFQIHFEAITENVSLFFHFSYFRKFGLFRHSFRMCNDSTLRFEITHCYLNLSLIKNRTIVFIFEE